jgi:hypothetical protein
MIKIALPALLVCVITTSCIKIHDCPKNNNSTSYDVGFYRGPDMRATADYVAIDGNKISTQIPQVGGPDATCSTSGMIHVSVLAGSHIVTIYRGDQGTNQTLVISTNGATLNGNLIPFQSCNNGHSLVIEDY